MRKQINAKKQLPVQFMDAKLMNLKEDAHLQQRLDLIDHKFRLVCKAWTQERAVLLREQRKLLCLRVCEPYASIDQTMKEITEIQKTRLDLLELPLARPTSHRRLNSCRYLSRESSSALRPFKATPTEEDTPSTRGLPSAALRRPKSAATSLGLGLGSRSSTAITRGLNAKTEPLSIRQLKEMAAIDCISRKELASRAEKARRERERMQALLKNKLNHKIQTFLRKLDHDGQPELTNTMLDSSEKPAEKT